MAEFEKRIFDIFGQESSRGGQAQRNVDDYPMHVDRCIFYEGKHYYAGPKCPHGSASDEFGEVHSEGWTVQN